MLREEVVGGGRGERGGAWGGGEREKKSEPVKQLR